MKYVFRLVLVVLMISGLLPLKGAEATGTIVAVFDGEAHLLDHRCSTLKKVLGAGTCLNDADKQPDTAFVLSASSKVPKKSGNATNCFGIKTPIALGKTYGPRGPLCDIDLAGMTGKKAGGLGFIGNCEASDGIFAGTFAVYESQAGAPKKVSMVGGTFNIIGGFGTASGAEAKAAKPQGGPFLSIFRLSAQDIEKGDTDTLDDCYEIAGPKDSPQQIGVTGIAWVPVQS